MIKEHGRPGLIQQGAICLYAESYFGNIAENVPGPGTPAIKLLRAYQAWLSTVEADVQAILTGQLAMSTNSIESRVKYLV
jgi:hypothetical protein